MNYEDKYKQALERAREKHYNAIDMGYHETAAEFEFIFPELKESENERIRKELIEFLSAPFPRFPQFVKRRQEEWLQWLEKQGKTEG